MSNCELYQEMISRMIDDELSEEERTVLARHLDICPECSTLYAAFSGLSAAIADDLESPPEELSDNIMAELRRADIQVKNRRKPRWRGALAAAACLALVIMAARFVPDLFQASSAAPAAGDMAAPAAYEYAAAEDSSAESVEEASPAEEPAAQPESRQEEDAKSGGSPFAMITTTDGSESGCYGDSVFNGIPVDLSGDRAEQFAAGLCGEECSLPEGRKAEAAYNVYYELNGENRFVFLCVFDGQVYYSFDGAVFSLSAWEKTELETLFFQDQP